MTTTIPTIPFAWADVLSGVNDFLASALVTGAVVATLAVMFAPRIISAIKRVVGRR